MNLNSRNLTLPDVKATEVRLRSEKDIYFHFFQMGYAKQGQNTKGIHIRQFSRAFIFEQDGERNVYVSADCGMMGQLVKMKVST